MAEADLPEPAADPRQIATRRFEFECGDRPSDSRAEWSQSFAPDGFDPPSIVLPTPGAEFVEVGDGDGASQRVTRERMPVEERFGSIFGLERGDDVR